MAREVRNITANLGPVDFGVAIDGPFDKSKGYNLGELSNITDFVVISSVPVQDVELAARVTEKPIYVRLSDDYVEYILSTQNVEGAVNYIEKLVGSGGDGIVLEYDVVYTPYGQSWSLHQSRCSGL